MMTKLFIGVPTKLLLLIVTTLFILGVGFSAISLKRLQDDFQKFQQDTLYQGQSQFDLHNELLRSKLRVWIESFADITHLDERDDFSELAPNLVGQFDGLQLHLNVEDVWLFLDETTMVYGTSGISKIVQENVEKVFEMQVPQHELYCQKTCQQLVSVPLLNKSGDMAVLTVSASLVDMLYSINTSLKSEVAILSFPMNTIIDINSATLVSTSNSALTNAILTSQQNKGSEKSFIKHGLNVDLQSYNYLINFLPLDEYQEKVFYLALIDDVTAFKVKNDLYRRQFLLSAIIIFIVLATIVYFIASPFTKRLLVLSQSLPLLARKEFDQFRHAKLNRRRFFPDELDILADSALELSYELEQLNIEVVQKTKELENIAMYDLLTGLPNRNMLNYQLRKSVASLARYKGGIAVLFLDLDDFKKVNDSHGHGEGDRLLIQAAERVRLSVGNIDLACRFGGDEFVIVLGQLNDLSGAVSVAEKILFQFKEPIKIGSNIFYISTSIGIAYTEDIMAKADDLISHADIAMYEAKDDGGCQYHVYHDDMYQKVAHRVMLEGEVRKALKNRQFSLSLQPQLEAKSKKLYGFEALLRWQHPDRGMISPDDFIPILENSEHMVILGYWVIRRSFEIAKEIKSRGLTTIRIAINLSAGQFMDPKLPDYLNKLLKEFSLSADHFELELTEQTLVRDVDRAIDVMKTLKNVGFTFAIDDFGTGYSSLAYLKKMPVDVIKIDKSFVFGMLENHADYQIIMSTIAMVKNLGLTVIAEGVESSAQLRSLTQNKCDLIQGYYFSKPIPETEIYDFIDKQIVDGYWKTKAQ